MANLIRTLRKAQGLTLVALAKQVGISHSYLSQLERNYAVPTVYLALRIVKALKADPYEVFPDWHIRIKHIKEEKPKR